MFSSFFKLPALEDAQLNWLHLFLSIVHFQIQHQMPCMYRCLHIGCICLNSIYCVFLNASSNGLHERMHSRIGCICWTFLRCVFSDVSDVISKTPWEPWRVLDIAKTSINIFLRKKMDIMFVQHGCLISWFGCHKSVFGCAVHFTLPDLKLDKQHANDKN